MSDLVANFSPLTAILEMEQSDSRLCIIDLANDTARMVEPNHIKSRWNHELTILSHAHEQLDRWQIAPTPDLGVICLTSIKKLIHKNTHEPLKKPNFSSIDEAVRWIKQISHDVFDRIDKLAMKNLAALECRVIPATMAMQTQGLPFNHRRWRENLTRISQELDDVKQKLQSLLPKEDGFLLFDNDGVDLNNHQAVKISLEKLLGHKLAGTSQSSLKDFDHDAVKYLIRYREDARMLSLYGENFLEKICNGRIKGHFVPLGTISGRFACHDMNLLALPNDDAFQECIEATPGRSLIYADYSAFELRILASLSGDQKLAAIFNDGLDIHSMVATEIFNTTVSKDHNAHLRNQAKALNFGLIYGMGEASLARELKISQTAAKEMMAQYFKRFAGVKDFLFSLEHMAKKEGYVATALGRRAYFSDNVNNLTGASDRLARNMPIQGTGADIIKLALVRAYRRFVADAPDTHVINLVHDEIVVECPMSERETIATMIQHEMSEAFAAICPEIAVDVSFS